MWSRLRPCAVLLLLLSFVELLVRCPAIIQAATAVTDKQEENKNGAASSFRIAGYLPDYRIHDTSIDWNATMALLDDVYLFSLSPQVQLGDNMFSACCLQPSHYERIMSVTSHHRPKVWVTVGGAGRSHKLTLAPSAMMRALAKLILEDYPNLMSGIDFDCELFLEHADYENYEKLVVAATNIFPPQGIAVSMALHVGQHTAFPMAVQKVDRINLMTYGMTSATYHADYTKMREAVEALLTAGITASKIFLGLPMYGTHKERGGGDTQAYHDLAAALADDPVRRHGAYELGDGYLVDSPAAIQAKVRFAQQKGLGGVFFWELGQDKDRVLLEAAARQAGKHIPQLDESVATTTTTTASAADEEEEPEPAEDLSENAAVPDRDEL